MTAYEVRISDWSSDVCSSDLAHAPRKGRAAPHRTPPADLSRHRAARDAHLTARRARRALARGARRLGGGRRQRPYPALAAAPLGHPRLRAAHDAAAAHAIRLAAAPRGGEPRADLDRRGGLTRPVDQGDRKGGVWGTGVADRLE